MDILKHRYRIRYKHNKRNIHPFFLIYMSFYQVSEAKINLLRMNESRNCSHLSALPTPFGSAKASAQKLPWNCRTYDLHPIWPNSQLQTMATGNGILAALHLWELEPLPKEPHFEDFPKAKSCHIVLHLTTQRETGAPTNVPAARSHHLPPGFVGTVFKGGSSKMLNDQVTIISSSPIIQSLKTGHSKLCQQAVDAGIGPHFWKSTHISEESKHKAFSSSFCSCAPSAGIVGAVGATVALDRSRSFISRCLRLDAAACHGRTHCRDFLGTTTTVEKFSSFTHDPPFSIIIWRDHHKASWILVHSNIEAVRGSTPKTCLC